MGGEPSYTSRSRALVPGPAITAEASASAVVAVIWFVTGEEHRRSPDLPYLSVLISFLLLLVLLLMTIVLQRPRLLILTTAAAPILLLLFLLLKILPLPLLLLIMS